MERVSDLTAIVEREVASYAEVDCWKCRVFFIADKQRQVYAVLAVDDLPRPHPAQIDVMARIVGNRILIEEDITDRLLVDALIEAGVPREQIILVYQGETLPEPVE